NPEKSIMGSQKFGEAEDIQDDSALDPKQSVFTRKHILVLLTFIVFIGFFIYGAFTMGWGINELVALFLMMGVVIAIIDRMSPNKFINTFVEGAKNITYGALVVGLA